MARPGWGRYSGQRRPPAELLGRQRECAELDQFLAAVRDGTARTLVLCGEPGVGKTRLLDYLAERASGCRVARASGVESEMELAYSALHQLLTPLLQRLDRLREPQRDALRVAFGQTAGPPPDRFLVGLATLSLLADVAEEHPLICVLDDEQWMDRASAQVFGFVARRLAAEPIGLLFAARTPTGDLAGLPRLTVDGLGEADARALLAAALTAPLDAQVTDRLIADSGGNPLALLELPRGLTPAELAGGYLLPDVVPVTGRIEESFRRRLAVLPDGARRLLLVAAAEPIGDPVLVWRAAEALGIPGDAAAPALEADLLEVGTRVRFRHPLVRSAVYRSAPLAARRAAHRALAEATDPETDPDRRAWHWAHATAGRDDRVAGELEQSAGRAQARGGIAAGAAFLERAAALTGDPGRRAERVLAASQASLQAGAFNHALELLAAAEAGPLDEAQHARVDLVRGHVAFASGRLGDAPRLLLNAARRLEPFDPQQTRESYLNAWAAAVGAGHLAEPGILLDICRAVRALPVRPGAPEPLDLLLDGLARLITDGRGAAAPTLLRAGRMFAGGELPAPEVVRWGWLAAAASTAMWDDRGRFAIAARTVRLVRDAGALAQLPVILTVLGTVALLCGDFGTAAAAVAEGDSVAAATGSLVAPHIALRLLALRGRDAEATTMITATVEQAGPESITAANAYWASAILHNGLGRYAEAATAARAATANPFEPWISVWALPELIEAAVRSNHDDQARESLDRLAETTQPSGTDWALGVEARGRALLSTGRAAEDRYREAVERLSRTELRPEQARAHLVYGEWLRREGRRLAARTQLRAAHELFGVIGMAAFAERARHELVATGERVRTRTADAGGELTPQEALIARLAAGGLSNPEIGARLFLSARTVKYHLGKVFTKLEITSRAQLARVLPADRTAQSV